MYTTSSNQKGAINIEVLGAARNTIRLRINQDILQNGSLLAELREYDLQQHLNETLGNPTGGNYSPVELESLYRRHYSI